MTSSRLSAAEALELYQHASFHDLGAMAHQATLRLHPEPERTYVIDRNINYSNVCLANCAFCNFKAGPDDPGGYVLPVETIVAKISELVDIGGTQVLLQGGLHPRLTLDWYEDLLRTVKSHFPKIHMHGFSPPEIQHFSRLFGLPVGDVLARLMAAGLDSLPGGGAEILVDRVRERISPGKCNTADWLDVMRQAHRLGMATSATMMFGSIETDAERIEHLARLRELQDETGGFIAFICWTFQHQNTPLARRMKPQMNTDEHGSKPKVEGRGPKEEGRRSKVEGRGPKEEGGSSRGEGRRAKEEGHSERPSGREESPLPPPDETRRFAQGDTDLGSRPSASAFALRPSTLLRLAGAYDYLRMLAVSRLFLDNVPNVQTSWVTQGDKIGQLGLFFGANDMGSVMMEENVVSSAGTTYRLDEAAIRHLIRAAGFTPHQRNQRYDLIEETGLAARAEREGEWAKPT